MPKDLHYGRRLTQREYEIAIVSLYSQLNGRYFDKNELQYQELNLTIDYRLGMDFPIDRREKLWIIQQKIEEKRVALLIKSVFSRLMHFFLHKESNLLANFVLKEYRQVLSPEEMKSYFG